MTRTDKFKIRRMQNVIWIKRGEHSIVVPVVEFDKIIEMFYNDQYFKYDKVNTIK